MQPSKNRYVHHRDAAETILEGDRRDTLSAIFLLILRDLLAHKPQCETLRCVLLPAARL